MKTIIAFLMALVVTHAGAVGIGNDNPPGGGGTPSVTSVEQRQTVGVSVDTRSAAAAFASGGTGGSSAAMGGSGGTGGSSTSSAGGSTSSAGGSTSSVTVNQASAPSKVTIRNNPDIALGNVYPTADCLGAITGGASGGGIAFVFGYAPEISNCEIGEVARGFEQAGHPVDAMHVRCQSKWAKVAPSCIALVPAKIPIEGYHAN